MFCKYCGKELESDALFCSSCGKKIEAAATEKAETSKQEDANTVAHGGSRQPQGSASASPEGDVWNKDSLKKLNPFCIAGLILIVLDVLLIHSEIFALAALIVSIIGFYSAKKKNQTGAALAIICMIVSGAIFLIWLI